jgi:hypothetical protein
MTENTTMHIPAQPNPVGLTLVWDCDRPRRIEAVTVHRQVVRVTPNGSRIIDTAISLPRVRFLEEPEDPPSSARDTTDATTPLADEEAPRLAA